MTSGFMNKNTEGANSILRKRWYSIVLWYQ